MPHFSEEENKNQALFLLIIDMFSCYSQVYSVVNGIVNVFIEAFHQNINDILIEKGYGEYCEENYLSKVSILE